MRKALSEFEQTLFEKGTSIMAIERFLGVDLAWGEGGPGRPANETGVVAIDADGRVLDAGWTRGLEATPAWVAEVSGDAPALMFIDAPLVVTNPTGQRLCDTQVGQRYGRWRLSANTVNTASPNRAGVALRHMLEQSGWRYSDGAEGPPDNARAFSECYPYTTLVGAAELGYETERPRYKRKPVRLPAAQWRPARVAACDELIKRLDGLATADPPLHLRSHPVTRKLLEEPSPLADKAYKHREDLIDAALCAWTAALWSRHGKSRCQVLGLPAAETPTAVATIIAPARPEQRSPTEPADGSASAGRLGR
jgi:predicted RNase H-like nuclease